MSTPLLKQCIAAWNCKRAYSTVEYQASIMKNHRLEEASNGYDKDDKHLDNRNTSDWTNLDDLEALNRPSLTPIVQGYFGAGAGTQNAVEQNKMAYKKYRLLPRCMVGVRHIDSSCKLFGRKLAFPIISAPMAELSLMHPDGEMGVAAAVANKGVGMCLSINATQSIEQVAAAGKDCPLLMLNIYIFRDRGFMSRLLRRGERAGFDVLVISVDTPRMGKLDPAEYNKIQQPPDLHLPNLEGLGLQGPIDDESQQYIDPEKKLLDDSATWEFIRWARQFWSKPIMVKGILSPSDAIKAVDAQVDGIIVSNHGGRQLDYAPAGLDMLPSIKNAVGNLFPVLMDGGIRRGTDILKALALGADCILLGRPICHGLAMGGQDGVEKVLQTLHDEFTLDMALAGRPTLRHITRDLVLGPHDQPIG